MSDSNVRRKPCIKEGNEEIDSFLESLSRRNRTDNTIFTYRSILYNDIRFLEENGLNHSAYNIGENEISFILKHMDVCEATKKLYVTILGVLCRYHTGRDPVREMDLLWNSTQRKRKFMNANDFRLLMNDADPTERMVLTLGAFAGMRRKEIAELRFKDIGRDHILIHGKGHGVNGKVRLQPVDSYVIFEAKRYMEWRQALKEEDRSEGRMIVLRSNGVLLPFTDRLSSLSNIIARLGRKNGLDISCHSLRRLYCTTLVEQKCPIETVRELMRHTNINTIIECYINPNSMDKRKWTEKCALSLCASAVGKWKDLPQ